MISCLKKLATCFAKLDQSSEAIHYLRLALEIVEKNDEISKEKKIMISLYDQLGTLYLKQ
jgi:hypothetical protein